MAKRSDLLSPLAEGSLRRSAGYFGCQLRWKSSTGVQPASPFRLAGSQNSLASHPQASLGQRTRIGISACFFHADPQRAIFKGKTLLYLEQSIAHWLMSENALPVLIPSVPEQSSVGLGHFAEELDGLVLEGGADLSPKSYGEVPLRPEWSGDFIRDQYELRLFREFFGRKKPVLGICRGAQLINVAFGGTLYQDLETQLSRSQLHRNWAVYDELHHALRMEAGSGLEGLFPDFAGGVLAKVNSIHHQGLKELGKGLVVEARAEADDVIEAIRLRDPAAEGAYVFGVQWHPEFHDPFDSSLLDSGPILREFLRAADERRRK